MRRGPSAGERGFTLLELGLAVALIGLLVTIVLPRLGLLGGVSLQASARQLASRIELLREDAALRGRWVRLSFDPPTGRYGAEVLKTRRIPAPAQNVESKPFWDAAKEGRFMIKKCNACGAKRFPPGPACQSCEAYDRGHDVAAGTGTVFSYVVHRHPPVAGKELPIVIALIDLDEGVRMVGEVVDVPDDEIQIGMRLHVDFREVDDDLTLPVWREA